MRQIILLTIAIVLSVSTSATSFGELTENWLQSTETTNGSKQTENPGPPGIAPTVPVGEGLLFLTVLAGAYAVFRRNAQGWYCTDKKRNNN